MHSELPAEKLRTAKFVLPFFLGNGLIYTLNTFYYTFMPIFLDKDCGFDDIERGILLSIGPFISVFALIFWGAVSDRAKYKNNVLASLVFASAVCFFAISFNSDFVYILAMISLLMFFMCPYGGLIDNLTFEYASMSRFPYGIMRITGTLMYSVFTVVITIITQTSMRTVFYLFIVLSGLSILTVKLMIPIKGHARKRGNISFGVFFRDRTLLTLILFLALCQFTYGVFTNFTPSYLITTLGLPDWIWGVTIFVSLIGEYVFFVCYGRLFAYFGVKKLLLAATFLCSLRLFFLSFSTNIVILLIISFITGSMITVVNYAVAQYINVCIPDELRASGQTLMYALSSSLPRILSGILGGVMVANLGMPLTMGICGGLLIAVLLISPLLKFTMPRGELNGMFEFKKRVK